MKWTEGRVSLFGYRSAAWYRRQERYKSAETKAGLTPDSPDFDDDLKDNFPMKASPGETVMSHVLLDE